MRLIRVLKSKRVYQIENDSWNLHVALCFEKNKTSFVSGISFKENKSGADVVKQLRAWADEIEEAEQEEKEYG